MRLGIDAREIENGVFTGIGRPLRDFLDYFASQDNDDLCILFSGEPIPFDFGARVKNVVVKETVRFLWDQITLSRLIKQEKIDVFYSPYYKIPLQAACPCVSALLDVMYIAFEGYRKKLSPLHKLYYATMGKLFARRSDKILTCSQYSKQDILKIYDVPDEKIEVIPLSISDEYHRERDQKKIEQGIKKWEITTPYILYVSNFKFHKNVASLITAFAKVVKTRTDLKLVLAGPQEYTYPDLCTLIASLSLTQRVIFTGKLDQNDAPHLLYSGAEAFVFPSLYEGFGIPPVEAMACGVPVIAANRTSVPEVVKDAAILVEPFDIEQIADAIKRVLDDHSLREELRAKGIEYAQQYRKDKIAAKTYAFFKNLSSG